MKLGAVGVVSYYFSAILLKLTGINISYIIVALIMGTIFTEIGFLDKDTLGKTEASGFILFGSIRCNRIAQADGVYSVGGHLLRMHYRCDLRKNL